MASKTEFTCDFCGSTIVKAAKSGCRGYCGERKGSDDNTYIEWDLDPWANINGPYICEMCIQSLVKSKAFNSNGCYVDK